MTLRRLSVRILGVLALAGIWLLLAPPALGGRTSYVVTSGISMEPLFRTGDLALVRTQSSYAVGEIVAYRSPTLGEVILHRIHSVDARGFRTEGDNNSWLDPDTVRPEEILGRLWLHVPRVGAFVHAGTLVPLAVLLAAGSVAVPVRSRWARRGRHVARKGGPVPTTPKRSLAPALLVAATVLGVSGAGLLVLAALATAPPAGPPAVVGHALELTYGAPGDPAVYQGGSLVTGDPVFLALNPSIDVSLHDRVTGPSPARARPLGLQARLVGAGGWQYVVALHGQGSVSGTAGDLHVRVDLSSLQAVVTRAAARTGSDAGSYRLQLLPSVAPADQGGPVAFPPVVFQVGGGQLVLADAPGRRGAAVTRTATEPAPGRAAPAAAARVVHLAGHPLPAAPLTVAGIAALGVAGLLAVAGVLRLRRDPLARLTQPLITVAARDTEGRTVMTGSVDDLFVLAQRYDRPVLQMVVAGRQTYAVEEGGVWYGCYVGRNAGDAPTDAPYDPDDLPRPPSPRRAPETSPDHV